MIGYTRRKLNLLFIALLSVCFVQWPTVQVARAADSPWTVPVNLSASGAASQPVVAVGPDGSMHVMWWDSVAGEQYAHVGVTETIRSEPLTVSEIVGARLINIDQKTQRTTITLLPPSETRLLTDAGGTLYAFWHDTDSRWNVDQITGTRRVTQTIAGGSITSFDVTRNGETGLQVAYVKSEDSDAAPAGVYYRTWTGIQWTTPVAVVTSSYFRSLKEGASTVSVASNGNGVVIVSWDDPHLGRSVYAHSEDGGTTWSTPQSVTSADAGVQTRVAYTPNTEFMMMWRNPVAGSCVLMQRRSNDGMQTWSAPQRVLESMARCPERWQFDQVGSDQMWLLGMPAAVSTDMASQINQGVNDQAVMALWNNSAWAAQAGLNLSFYDTTVSRTVSLGCINLSLWGDVVGMVGCDSKGDVWVVRSQESPKDLVPMLTRPWSELSFLSQAAQGSINEGSLGELEGYPALASDAQGHMYGLWGQPVFASTPRLSIFASVWDGQSWSQSVQVLDSPLNGVDNRTGQYASRAEQPTLTADGTGHLHAVWASGPGGLLYYSKVEQKDVLSAQDWSDPVTLPAPAQVASWPDIVADPRSSSLYVVYAVPYNEKRGIYLLQSNDAGASWAGPTQIFDAVTAGWLSADKPQITLDAQTGLLHAVWLRSELPGSASSSAIFYSRSTDGGKTWASPTQLIEGDVDWPRVSVSAANQVLVLWNQMQTNGKAQTAAPMSVWERSSANGGAQWEDATRVPGFEQVSGPVGVTSDQAGVSYLVGVGMTADGESSLLYAQKAKGRWQAQDSYGLGQEATQSDAASITLLPGLGRLGALMRGWVWQADGSGQYSVLAASRGVSVTQVITPVATFTPVPLPTATITPQPVISPTPTQVQVSAGITQAGQGGSSSGQSAIVIAGVLAMIIVVGGIVGRSVIRARHG
jgi:hypothetical protein